MRAAVDIGGTFTDLVYLDEDSGVVNLGKTSTTPGRFEDGVLHVLDESNVHGISFLAHGTTVIINALTERRGSTTALLTTRGFRDVLEIARSNRPDIYNLSYRKPRPFVPRRLRLEVTERINHKGAVVVPLEDDDVRAAIEQARTLGAESIAICFLHSYANPTHEQRAADIVRQEWPEITVTASTDLTNEWREYERTCTAVLDAYVKPTARAYLTALDEKLAPDRVSAGGRFIMQSNGGVTRFQRAAHTPINMVESGPVGGVIGAAAIGQLIGEPNLITLDIGGTTAKASLVENAEIRLTGEYHIEKTPSYAGYPIRVPVVDIIEIGSGGGSIAWLDEAGALKVGPRSAGAEPGPASYGRGGQSPTVTDANLLAGRINPGYFLGGRIRLDPDRAREAFTEVASALSVTVPEAALGVIRIANASMVHLLKLVSVRRGRDPRDFALIAFGGGGSMHASALARELHVPRIIVPPAAGHFSAWGMLMSDLRHDIVQTRFLRIDDGDLTEIASTWDDLTSRIRTMFEAEGLDTDTITLARSADLRYEGQEHTVTVPAPAGAIDEHTRTQILQRFHELHEQLYTFRLDAAVEAVNFRLTGFGPVAKPKLAQLDRNGDSRRAVKGHREIDLDDLGRVDATILERSLLGAGTEINGPAVVEEPAASTVVFPGQRLEVDAYGNLIIHTEA